MRLRVEIEVIVNSLRFPFGMSLAFGLIGTSVALGDFDVTFAPAVEYAAGDGPRAVPVFVYRVDRPWRRIERRETAQAEACGSERRNGKCSSAVAIGDLDGDQRLDLAVANGETFAQIYTVSILLGIGDGTFAGAVDYAADVGPASVLRWSSRLVIFAYQGDPYAFGCPDDPCQDNIVNPCP